MQQVPIGLIPSKVVQVEREYGSMKDGIANSFMLADEAGTQWGPHGLAGQEIEDYDTRGNLSSLRDDLRAQAPAHAALPHMQQAIDLLEAIATSAVRPEDVYGSFPAVDAAIGKALLSLGVRPL